jgi:hypothetical protein
MTVICIHLVDGPCTIDYVLLLGLEYHRQGRSPSLGNAAGSEGVTWVSSLRQLHTLCQPSPSPSISRAVIRIALSSAHSAAR